jgi:hypothetical protein
MEVAVTQQEAMEWSIAHFADAELGDVRRSKDSCDWPR